MTKKDYDLIARQFYFELEQWRDNSGPVYGTEAVQALESMARRMAKRLAIDNPRFDEGKFLSACGMGV